MQSRKNLLPFALRLTIFIWIFRFFVDVVLAVLIDYDYNQAITDDDVCGMILLLFTYTQVIRLVLKKTNAVTCLMCGMFAYALQDVGSFTMDDGAIIKWASIWACALDVFALLCLLSKPAKVWVERNKCMQTESHWLLIITLNCLFFVLLLVFYGLLVVSRFMIG